LDFANNYLTKLCGSKLPVKVITKSLLNWYEGRVATRTFSKGEGEVGVDGVQDSESTSLLTNVQPIGVVVTSGLG
jgi:hypothetical protein